MWTFWHDIWGSGRGPAARLAPQSRILVGTIVFAACLTAPAFSAPGTALIVAATAAWVAACSPPVRTVRSFLLLGLAMFLPYFLLVPLLLKRASAASPGTGWLGALAVPWNILLHGLAGVLLAGATISTLTGSDLRSGLLALPLPRVFTAILIQIVHQTSALLAETKRVAAAIAVRGASGSGRAALRALTSLPRVWLPRIVDRADRLGAAMEFRGYAEADLRVFGQRAIGAADAGVIALAAAVLALAAALRWRWL
jgi:energy-coupling factor transporter transmembrane protein EcfT